MYVVGALTLFQGTRSQRSEAACVRKAAVVGLVICGPTSLRSLVIHSTLKRSLKYASHLRADGLAPFDDAALDEHDDAVEQKTQQAEHQYREVDALGLQQLLRSTHRVTEAILRTD